MVRARRTFSEEFKLQDRFIRDAGIHFSDIRHSVPVLPKSAC
jgi:hypothetical protein